jgi:hypothetical protein
MDLGSGLAYWILTPANVIILSLLRNGGAISSELMDGARDSLI